MPSNQGLIQFLSRSLTTVPGIAGRGPRELRVRYAVNVEIWWRELPLLDRIRKVAEKGWIAEGYSEADGASYMKRAELEIFVDVGVGAAQATVWTCDLTHAYVDINADYRS